MQHMLWIVGQNHVVALDFIASVKETNDGNGLVIFKDGTKEKLDAQELEYLIKGILQTQKKERGYGR